MCAGTAAVNSQRSLANKSIIRLLRITDGLQHWHGRKQKERNGPAWQAGDLSNIIICPLADSLCIPEWAWQSHHRSSSTTWLATVRLRPRAAALRLTIRVITYTKMATAQA